MSLRARRIPKDASNGDHPSIEAGATSDVKPPVYPSRRLRYVQAAGFFLLGFAMCVVLQKAALPHQKTEGLPMASPRACHRLTKAGLCVGDVFDIVDDVYSDLWPGRVDLLIRSYISDKFFLTGLLFHSLQLMWPKGLGDVVLVLDEGSTMAVDMVPYWVKVYYEKNYLELPGKILQQWSYAWADNYTTAPFVAIVDDDVVFSLKVTPPLLFNLSTGKPYLIASNQSQEDNWLPSTHFFVGPNDYFANFMVQLPFVVPRGVFSKFREHVGRIHPEHGGTYDGAMKWFAANGPMAVSRRNGCQSGLTTSPFQEWGCTSRMPKLFELQRTTLMEYPE